jgi:hypothetical protein
VTVHFLYFWFGKKPTNYKIKVVEEIELLSILGVDFVTEANVSALTSKSIHKRTTRRQEDEDVLQGISLLKNFSFFNLLLLLSLF